jgi:hypothetical protein
LSDHLSAMPSIHVGWAVLFAIAAWSTRSILARVLATGHAVLTSYVVVVTGNHFWLDGVVAAAMVAVAWPMVAKLSARAAAIAPPRADKSPMPVPEPVADCVP